MRMSRKNTRKIYGKSRIIVPFFITPIPSLAHKGKEGNGRRRRQNKRNRSQRAGRIFLSFAM
jgi:hypothetical protein